MTLSFPRKTNIFLFFLLLLAANKNIVLCQANKTALEQLEVHGDPKDITAMPRASINPGMNQSPPEIPFSVSLVSTGTFYNPARLELVACVTHPEGREIEKVEFYCGEQCLGTVEQAPFEMELRTEDIYGNFPITAKAYDSKGAIATATTTISILQSQWFRRGLGFDPKYLSCVIALDGEEGIFLDKIDDYSALYQSFPWFLRADSDEKEACVHLMMDPNINNPTNISVGPVNTLPKFNNVVVGAQPPMVAFGSAGGGSPLYVNQAYSLGILYGLSYSDDTLKIEVYDKDDFALGQTKVKPVFVKTYEVPPPSALSAFDALHDIHLHENLHGKTADLDLQIQYISGDSGSTWYCSPPFYPMNLTHRSSNSNFYYKISFKGGTINPLNPSQIIRKSVSDYNLSYSIDFDDAAPWSAIFLHNPHFQNIAIPIAYEGKSVDELIHQAPEVKDTLLTPEKTGLSLLQMDHSPELKHHSQLDELSESLGNDPLAIANYVHNEIELTDAVGYNTQTKDGDFSLNSQGVMRDALATYMEGQGSPIEQCALLIYLLRKAGVRAGYVFPEHDGTLMFDQELSKMLHMQIRGALSLIGQSYVPELIPVNYPWVAAYIEGKWIHLFPWIKETEVIEGKNIWNYFPDGYNTSQGWLLHYILNDPSIRGLSEHGEEDNAGALLKLYAQEELRKVNLTLDDVGMKFRNRTHQYTDWRDFPRPWKTPLVTQDHLAQNLNVKDNPSLASELTDIFDTINIQVISDRNHNGAADPGEPMLETGPMRFVDLHNRRLLLYHQIIPGTSKYEMILSLEPYESNEDKKETYTFHQGAKPDPGDLQCAQKISTLLQTTSNPNDPQNDDTLLYKISSINHQQAIEGDHAYYKQFPGLLEATSQEIVRSLRKGDMAAFSINYGRVSPKMLQYALQKYQDYEHQCDAHPESQKNPEQLTGQILHSMGQGYYGKVSDTAIELENLMKGHTVSWKAFGLSKLSPERNQDGSPVTIQNGQDFNLVYPRVDMFYSRTALLGNQTSHLESGESGLKARDLMQLILVDGSAQEHRIINDFFNQKSAISTIKLLDIAQGWNPETGVASHPGIGVEKVDSTNYNLEQYIGYSTGNPYTDQKTVKDWASLAGIWSPIEDILSKEEGRLTTVFMTPSPVTAPGQEGKAYTGMGCLILSDCFSSALISDSISIDHGGYGGATTPISSMNPDHNNDFNTQINNWINQVREYEAYRQVQNQYHGGNTKDNAMPPPPDHHNTPNQSSPSSPVGTPPTADSAPNTPPTADSAPNTLPPADYASNPPASAPLPAAQIAILKQEIASKGFTGAPSYYGKLCNHVMDPVSVVTGEFYINALDLKLNGPMPLELRRTYGSQNLSENSFGGGWKLGYFPYLMLSEGEHNGTPASLIYAAEMDGSVIAYRYEAMSGTWKPLPADNPDLMNPNDGSPQPSQNLFNNVICKENETTYVLSGSDGSRRSFSIKSFPLPGSPEITRTRPYLDTWRDNQGNGYTFTYGNDQQKSDYGELAVITSSNASSLHFAYDRYGHILEVFSSDGRHLGYQYDRYGDLVKAILADHSVITYAYKHATDEKGSYSTHLLTEEKNPNGRIVQNSYDSQRRVISQASTVGVSPTPTTSATFSYNVTSGNANNTIHGSTSVQDAAGNTTTYFITNSQISKTAYPQNRTISENWDETARVLTSRTDARGLVTTLGYDTHGNLTSRTLQGNITGSGAQEIAKTTFTYNTNNMVTAITDALGNTTAYSYSDANHSFNPTSITKSAEGKTTSLTKMTYQAQGLPSSISMDGFTKSFSYDAHGFLSSITQATGTSDPNVTTQITTSRRGEVISEQDDRGIMKKYSYDALGNPIFEETFGPDHHPMDWHAWYYNSNGELEWEQGARFNPVDYTYYEYDRAGHLLHQGVWLSAASSDGKKVNSAGMAATSFCYDTQGNCTSLIDPNGHTTTMTYDPLGNMISRCLGDGAASESFTYEPGGKVATHTTVLGGHENYSYNSLGQIVSASHADGSVSSYCYDLSGRMLKETFPNGTSCQISYQGNTITRTFLDAQGKNLGITSEIYDGRGNLISKTDLAGNSSNYSYDGLGRLKTEEGPLSKKTYYYKPGCVSWVNEQGEWQNSFFDGIGRLVLLTRFNADGSIAYNESKEYSGDHQSVTTKIGSGSDSMKTTTYSDLQGRPLIEDNENGPPILYAYDLNGNLSFLQDKQGNSTSWGYDSLNHLTYTCLPGGNTTLFAHNALGEVLTRTMPGGLEEKNEYDQAGQKVADSLKGSDGSITRNHTYTYTQGLLSLIHDPRGFTSSFTYDPQGHPLTITSSGSKTPEQNQITSYSYDPRGLLTSVAQSYADPSTGPSTLVARDYDKAGHLISEATSMNGALISSWKQSWDAVGNRTRLTWNMDTQGPEYQFSYNALGLITKSEMIDLQGGSQSPLGRSSYTYGDHGLLLSKETPSGTTRLTRDAQGNITTIDLPEGSTESLSWRADRKLASYSIVGTQNETRNYQYDEVGRLTEEPYTLIESVSPDILAPGTQGASYHFNPLNIRTSQQVNEHVANMAQEINNLGQVILDSLDQYIGTTLMWHSAYDTLGEVISRISSHHSEKLTWDSFGRLIRVEERNPNNQGYNWSTTYDGLGRRIQTSYADATATQETSSPLSLRYYYDPEVEYLELGHDDFGRTWNLYGPDRSGLYGGAQGIGGLEATYNENSGIAQGVVNNFFGDALGLMTESGFYPWGNVLGGYGAMPGSSVNTDLVPQWRGHYLDWTGFYSMGSRYYEPNSGRFLSPDPLGHDASWSLYDYCAGDPVNGLDPDGRCVEKMERGAIALSKTQYQNTTFMNSMINTRSDLPTTLRGIAGELLSFVDGDLDDPSFLEARNTALQRRSNPEQLMSINGIFTDALRAQANAISIANSMGLDNNAVLPINNYTRGWRDLPRAFLEQLGCIDLRSICFADIVNYHNGGKAIAYSNGSVVVSNSAPYMSPSAKENFQYTGLNPQRYIENNEAGFNTVTNARNRYDLISILFPSNYFKKWDSTLATDTYCFDLLGNHSFQRNLPLLLQR